GGGLSVPQPLTRIDPPQVLGLELRSGRTTAIMPEEGDNAHGSPTPATAVTTTSAAPPLHTQAVKNRQRDPPLFAGSSDSDVHDWLKSYDRASQHNRWDDSFKLANVVFFLKETALQWFDNHEDEFNSWDAFKTRFAGAFGKPEQRRQQAKETLAHRYQVNTESSLAYIEDVLRLCRRVDAHMPEEDRIRHLFKGLSQELFTIVAPKSPPTVQHLIDECKKYEELQSARINKQLFERLPEVVEVFPFPNLSLASTHLKSSVWNSAVAALQPLCLKKGTMPTALRLRQQLWPQPQRHRPYTLKLFRTDDATHHSSLVHLIPTSTTGLRATTGQVNTTGGTTHSN
ncbi:uncharacterized protein ISCGN_032152, partial [Ixodes scapularis]